MNQVSIETNVKMENKMVLNGVPIKSTITGITSDGVIKYTLNIKINMDDFCEKYGLFENKNHYKPTITYIIKVLNKKINISKVVSKNGCDIEMSIASSRYINDMNINDYLISCYNDASCVLSNL